MKLRTLMAPVLVWTCACSSASAPASRPDAGAEASPAQHDGAAASADAAPEAGGCNDLALEGAPVPVQQVASDPPAQQGGTLAEGTYVLTSAVVYTGPLGPTGESGSAQTTLRVTSGQIQTASIGQPASRTLSFTVQGADITTAETCPGSTVTHATFTATPTTLVAELPAGSDDAGPRTLVETFARQ